eukprot:1158938-Pelagomonas_calceolata.AAC.3
MATLKTPGSTYKGRIPAETACSGLATCTSSQERSGLIKSNTQHARLQKDQLTGCNNLKHIRRYVCSCNVPAVMYLVAGVLAGAQRTAGKTRSRMAQTRAHLQHPGRV